MTNTCRQTGSYNQENQFLFWFFCLWSFVLLCRPQDYVTVLTPLRPALISSAIMVFLTIIYSNRFNTTGLLQEKQIKYYLALLMVMIIGIPTSLYARLSFETIFIKYIIVILYFFIFYKIVDTVRKLSVILLLGCLGSGLYFVVAILSGLTDYGRLFYGSMFDPNDLAYFALGFLPLNLLFVRREKKLLIRLGCLCALGAGILLILLSGSRGGILGFVAALMIFFTKTRTVKASMKFAVLLACLVFLAVAPINYERYGTILSIGEDYNVQAEGGRLTIWKIGLNAMLANPLTGVGVMCFPNVVGLDRVARGSETLAWQSAHNSAIQIGTETGVIGFVLFLLMSFNVLRIFNRARIQSQQDELIRIAEMGLVGFVGMFIAAMFLSQAYSIYWAFYVVFSAVVNQMLVRELASKFKVVKNG